MKKVLYGMLTVFFVVLFTQCGKDDDDTTPQKTYSGVNIDLRVEADGQEVKHGDIFSFAGSYDFRITELKFYVSNMEFQNTNGIWIKAEPKVELINIRESGSNTYNISVPEGEYIAVRYHIGLDSVTNHKDPTSFDIDHPLSAYNAMHWNWNLLYRFAIVEGRANTFGDFVTDPNSPNQNVNFSMHPGTSEMLVINNQTLGSTVTIQKVTSITQQQTMTFVVNVNDWLNGPGGSFDPLTENHGHAEPHDFEQTKKFGLNFGASISVQF
jgi:hypothetical protein